MSEDAHVEALLQEIGALYELVLHIARRAHDRDDALTATQRLALIEIVDVGPLRIRGLARRLDATPATATRAVDGLEELGYVVRRPSPNDGRGVLVEVTPRGRRWAERRRGLVRRELEQLPETVVPKRLIRDLALLNAALRSQTGSGDVPAVSLL